MGHRVKTGEQILRGLHVIFTVANNGTTIDRAWFIPKFGQSLRRAAFIIVSRSDVWGSISRRGEARAIDDGYIGARKINRRPVYAFSISPPNRVRRCVHLDEIRGISFNIDDA